MADPTPTPAPTPVVKTVKHHGLLDKHQLAEISRTTTLYGVASDPAVFAKIQDDQIITPDFMTQLGKDLDGMSDYTGGALDSKVDSTLDTSGETAAKKSLLTKSITSRARPR